LTLGTRGSALALAQTQLTLDALRGRWPEREFAIRAIKTTGDQRQDLSLTHLAPGGHGYVAAATVDGSAAVTSPPAVGKVDPGIFTRELEAELLGGAIDVAVHSLKDLPTMMPLGLTLAAVLPRANPADMLIWKELPGDGAPAGALPMLRTGAWVATSSLRRERQLQQARPDLRVCEVRGNVNSRLRKLHEHPEWSAMILAVAGLERLGYAIDWSAGTMRTSDGLQFRVKALDGNEMLPAVGQGAIGLQTRREDVEVLAALTAINHGPTWQRITAERELLRLLGGGCQLPLGVATAHDETRGELRLRAVLFATDGSARARFADVAGPAGSPLEVARDGFEALISA
jgi:hydroxymethylbilane synthase